MKILIIRHADPNYEIDGLTPKGEVEAELLSKYMLLRPLDYAYISPMGRAQRTAEYTLKAKGMQGETMPWLAEFYYPAYNPKKQKESFMWDYLPSYYAEYPNLFQPTSWQETEFIKNTPIPEGYRFVTEGLDALMKKHGYEREGMLYRVHKSNTDTIAFFCHFGLECILLSHLTGIAPASLLHHFCAAPSSVTTLVSEEREQGVAQFRCLSFGSTEHLALGGEDPSFSARFCEIFDSPDRH